MYLSGGGLTIFESPEKRECHRQILTCQLGQKRQCLCPRDTCLTKGRHIPYYGGGDFCDISTLSHSVLIDRGYKLVFPTERLHRDYMSNSLPCGYFFLKTRSVGIPRVLWLSVWGSQEQKVTAEEHVWTLWYF